MEHTKQALFLLPLIIRRPCKLCLLGVEWNEKILQWLREGVPLHQVAEWLTDAGHHIVQSQVSKHKKHLLKALKEVLQTQGEQQPSELEALRVQLQLEKEKRAQMELAHTQEENIRAAINVIRRHLSPDTLNKVEQAIFEEEHRSADNSRHA